MGWSMSAKTLYERLRGGEALTVIDVRLGKVGEIPGAVHVPVTDLEDDPRSWPEDRDLVVFCQHGGGGSIYAAEVLAEQGYSRVYVLEGGLDAYLEVAVEKAGDQPSTHSS